MSRRSAQDPHLYVLVKVPRPQDYSAQEALEFIRDAVRCWGGQLCPDDELFDLFRPATARIVGAETVLRMTGRTKNGDADQ